MALPLRFLAAVVAALSVLGHVRLAMAATTTTPGYSAVPACTEKEKSAYMSTLDKCGACIYGGDPTACAKSCCVKELEGQVAVCTVGTCCVRFVGNVVKGGEGMFVVDEIMLPDSKSPVKDCSNMELESDKCKQCAVAYGAKQNELPCATVSVPMPGTAYSGPAKCVDAKTSSTTTPKTTLATEPNSTDLPADSSEEPDQQNDATSAPPSVTPKTSTTKKTPEQAESVASTCFPDFATVRLQSGDVKRMGDLEIGDWVQVSTNEFSPVFMFTHRMSSLGIGPQTYSRLVTASGHALTLTPSHYLYVNGALKPAGVVVPGDVLVLADGRVSEVRAVGNILASAGLYNPQTLHGDIVVDGIVASTYTTAVRPNLAHAALSPLRAVYSAWHLSSYLLESSPQGFSAFLPVGAFVEDL